MPHINFQKRISRLATRICSWFKKHRDEDLNFGEILDKYCEIGMSRRHVARLLMDMKGITDGIRLGDVITIKDTPLWETWKTEYSQDRCEFSFHGKFPGNQYHGNLGKPKRKKKIFRQKGKVDVDYACIECQHRSSGKARITVAPKYLIALKAYRCPECNKYGTNVGRFQLNNETVYKAVVNGKEEFVEEKGKNLVPIKRKETTNG